MAKKIIYKTIYNLNFDNRSKEEIEDIISNAVINANKKLDHPEKRLYNSKNQRMKYFLFNQKMLVSEVDGLEFASNSVLTLILGFLKLVLNALIICSLWGIFPWVQRYINSEIPIFDLIVGIFVLIAMIAIEFLFQRFISYIKLSIESFNYSSDKIISFLSAVIALISLIISIITMIIPK